MRNGAQEMRKNLWIKLAYVIDYQLKYHFHHPKKKFPTRIAQSLKFRLYFIHEVGKKA